jgi:recombination endonuclease VII
LVRRTEAVPYDDDETVRAIASATFREWADANREARAAYMREYAQKNRERLREHKRRYREANREKIREASRQSIRDENGELTTTYKERLEGKTAKWRQSLVDLAGRPRPEVCDICGGPPDPKKGMHFDHCHQTGKFRGWLCRKCNLMLGNAEDDPARLRAGAAYLERY